MLTMLTQIFPSDLDLGSRVGAAVSGFDTLALARIAGIEIELDGGDLALQASVEPPESIIQLLTRDKPDIVAILRPDQSGWTGEDWRVFFDERAGLAEFENCLSRSEAESRASESCVTEWLNRNPARSLPGQCAACGGPNHEHDILLPYGVEPAGLTWLHSRCWSAWHRDRTAQAKTALAMILMHTGREPFIAP
jgi:hypothetical protein